ncbi:hypothetical protein JQN72_17185 [Phycicoccus sp. CSK15P-2]|uniref:pilus assembly protein TadG-related protein n=1 Tax=Phycicoccus sp. CSK15P-2 TaxID=2807627 RepID=UPI001950FDF4|nr:pilus assembly protein TadG-related protein [Phycicoccus sp. CSK15P-2]MBM6405979.1 hypothetical protein [Phycicoccus sp. CSK15P-2]
MTRPPRARTQRRAERGAAAALVAIVFGTGVLLGVSALALDVGSIWHERRQLQNSADAAALALASKCAKSPTSCTSGSSVVSTYANANVRDGATSIDGVCGRFSGTGFTPAGAWTACASATDDSTARAQKQGNLGECLPLPDSLRTGAGSTTPYVEVKVGTGSGTTQSLLPGIFAKAVTGRDNPHVTACARAAWGPAQPTTQHVLNITMSECDWRAQTGYTGPGTAVYPAGPTGSWPGYTTGTWPSSEQRIYTKGNPTSCDTSAPGGTAPGGFAALAGAVSCNSDLTVGPSGYMWAQGDPGNDLPCTSTELSALRGTVVHLPVFDCQTDAPVTVTSTTDCNSGNGSHNYYRISGYAAFYVAGWRLSSDNVKSIRPPNANACTGGDRCLVGWFLKDVVATAPSAPATGGAPNYGLTGAYPAG